MKIAEQETLADAKAASGVRSSAARTRGRMARSLIPRVSLPAFVAWSLAGALLVFCYREQKCAHSATAQGSVVAPGAAHGR